MKDIDLYELGLSEEHARQAAAFAGRLFLARVSLQFGDIYKVITGRSEIQARTAGKLEYSAVVLADFPVVGDWVLVDRTDNDSGDAIIHRVLSRRSCFERIAAGTGNERQVVAANIDTLFICTSLNNDFNLRRIERYLSIAWDSNAVPVIVLTKSDLCDDCSRQLMEIESAAVGVDIVITTTKNNQGVNSLRKYLDRGKTAAFVGSSGVGKSTLINMLMGEEVLPAQGIRNDDRGRHTTTNRQLLRLPGGGLVIDTPGMRELQIAGADLTKSFPEIEQFADQCYFRDCRHESEPGCGVKKALEDGLLSAERFASYQKLRQELIYAERKSKMSAAQVEKLKVIDMIGSLKGLKNFQKMNRKNKGK